MKVPYIQRNSPQGVVIWYIEEEDVDKTNRVDCYACKWKSKWCDVCSGRWWNHEDMKWWFSCECWMTVAYANCPENAEIPYCECMDDE